MHFEMQKGGEAFLASAVRIGTGDGSCLGESLALGHGGTCTKGRKVGMGGGEAMDGEMRGEENNNKQERRRQQL